MNTKEVWNRFREIGMPRIASISLVYILSGISLLLSTSEAQTSGTWMQTGSMTTGRYAIRAIELENGKVLVTGGIGASSTVLTSAELYDPTTGNWSPTGSMNKGRAYYTAALLRNGQVLVAGGCTNSNCSTATNTAEIYDSNTGMWRNAGKMSTLRYFFNATPLEDGNVLVEGGCNRGNCVTVTSTAELFNPRTRQWTVTGSMHIARDYHTATKLSSGRVLVTGGYAASGASNSVEAYDPASGVWTMMAPMISGRALHSATALPDGRVVVAGTGNLPSAGTETYDPVTNLWSAAGNLNTTRSAPVGVLLPTGEAMVAGGYSFTRPHYFDLASCELFDPTTNTWAFTGAMTSARYLHGVVVLANGQVLAAGGMADSLTILSSADIYTP